MGKRKKKKQEQPTSQSPVTAVTPPDAPSPHAPPISPAAPPPASAVPAPIVAAPPPTAAEPSHPVGPAPVAAETPVGFGWVVAGLTAATLASLMIFTPKPPTEQNGAAPADAVPVRNTAVPAIHNEHPTPSAQPPKKEDLSDQGEVASREVTAAGTLDDAKRDGWDTEVFADAAQTHAKHMIHLLADPGKIEPAHLEEFVAPEFRCGDLRPRGLKPVFQDAALTDYRDPDLGVHDVRGAEFHGAPGLADALAALREPFHGAPGVNTYLKIWHVHPVPDSQLVETQAYFEASGPIDGGFVQINATWQITFHRIDDKTPPPLTGLLLLDYEEVVSKSPQHTLFSDCTEAVLGKNDSFQRQLKPGLPQWIDRLEDALNPQQDSELIARYGIAVGDVNGDGLEDIYVCQPEGMPNRLYVQNPDGSATDRSAEAGVDWMERSMSALFIDLDNDGDQDLVIATSWAILVMENDGTGKFTLRATPHAMLEDVQSMCAADYDNDGDLDFYVTCDYVNKTSHPDLPFIPFVFTDANDAANNYLLRNDGNWKFTEVTDEVGLGENNRRHSLAAEWEDYDNDGDLDLFVANDFGTANLYRNDGGKFHDVAVEAGAKNGASGMSVTFGDYDNDGNMDIYISNMWSSAGGRITYQPKWKDKSPAEIKANFQHFTHGNTLLHNLGNGKFEDVTDAAGVTNGRWAWSSNFVDVNNDGREDLFVANGHLTGSNPVDL